MNMLLLGKSRVCTFPTGECGKYMAEWEILWFPVSGARSTLSLAGFVLWDDTSQEQAENSNALGPAPRTCSGVKCHQVGGLGSPSRVRVMLWKQSLGESCWIPALYVQRPAQHKETEQKQGICFNCKNIGIIAMFTYLLSVFEILRCFTIYDTYTGFSIRII